MHNHLLALFTQDNTSSTPREVVHTPERVDREEETVHRVPERTRRVSQDEDIPDAVTYERR